MTDFDWNSLGQLAPDGLAEPRLVLHHASQLAAAAGASLLPPRPDDSHPNLGWEPGAEALVGHPIEAAGSVRVAIRPRDLSLLLLDAAGNVLETVALPGRTPAESLRELQIAIGLAAGRTITTPLTCPDYELPHHAVADGASFPASSQMQAAWSELGAWFGGAHAALDAVRAHEPGASDVRCWPHHFDIATLIVHATGEGGSPTQTIGVGMSPGDESYAEPYWYVSPWPYPETGELPPLEGGAHWHREGFTAAILPGSRLLAATHRAGALEAYLTSAVTACHRIHGD